MKVRVEILNYKVDYYTERGNKKRLAETKVSKAFN